MEVASGVLAVLSLSIQLTHTVKRTTAFLKDVHEAPGELTRLAETLDQLALILNQVTILIEQQQNIGGLPGSIALIENALNRCGSDINKLDSHVNKIEAYFSRQGRVRKVWASLRTAMKKEDIEQVHKRMHENMANLHTTMIINMSNLQLYQIQAVTTYHQPRVAVHLTDSTTTAPLDSGVGTNDLMPLKRSRLVTSKMTRFLAYSGIFGLIATHEKAKFLKSDRSEPEEAISWEKKVLLAPSFVGKVFEMRYHKAFSHVSRTLRYFPVVPNDANVFYWCRNGDIESFQNSLNHHKVSPFVRDQFGRTLLHHASAYNNSEICLLLIQLGVDADHIDVFGRKAFNLLQVLPVENEYPAPVVDTVRVVAKAQDDVTTDDVLDFCKYYLGPVEGLEVLLSIYGYASEMNREGGFDSILLALALRQYGLGDNEWETFIRRLLRSGADVHGRRCTSTIRSLTHLDDLFDRTYDPFDTSAYARRWLSILGEEGFDVAAYMEKEVELHADQDFFTHDLSYMFTTCHVPRQLFFQTGEHPNIWWDWWIDPSSAANIVLKEFRHMNMHHFNWYIPSIWEDIWPFEYSPWSRIYEPLKSWSLAAKHNDPEWITWDQQRKLTQSRLLRRARKIYPELFHDTSKGCTMPGTWIDEDYDWLDF